MRKRAQCWGALVILLGAAGLGSQVWAETYLWTDGQGRVHMTDDLSQVPAEQRAEAARAAEEASRADLAVPGSYVDPAVRRAARSAAPRSAPAGAEPRRHVLRVEVAGSEMRVVAVVDGVNVPFILDTGASICALPGWALAELGVKVDEDTPMTPVVGISGEGMLVPEIRVDSVSLGDAVVEDLHMAVLDTMSEGLLGMPFFNHFKVSTDPAAGTLILEEVDLDRVPGMVAGLNERAWRSKFAQRRHALRIARERLESVPYEYITIRERLEDKVEYWERQLELLDIEASRAGVPQEWRDEE